MTLISVFLIGLHFTSLPAGPYLRDDQTLNFLVKDLTVIGGITGTLPGVFNELPYKAGINGSLWTLPWEIRMYAGLLMLWLAILVVPRIRSMPSARIFVAAVVLVTALSACKHFSNWFFHGEIDERFRLAYMFFSGALYQLLKNRVHLLPGRQHWRPQRFFRRWPRLNCSSSLTTCWFPTSCFLISDQPQPHE